MSIHTNLQAAINATNALSAALQALNADLTGGVTPAAAYGAPNIPATAIVVGDMVTVAGRLYNGLGRVKKIMNPGDARFKNGQHAPQFTVKAANGKTYRYNGTDLAEGKISFLRKPTGGDLRNFAL